MSGDFESAIDAAIFGGPTEEASPPPVVARMELLADAVTALVDSAQLSLVEHLDLVRDLRESGCDVPASLQLAIGRAEAALDVASRVTTR